MMDIQLSSILYAPEWLKFSSITNNIFTKKPIKNSFSQVEGCGESNQSI